MKNCVPCIILLMLVIGVSCDIQSITVKGNPGLYVPLGSPFAGLKDDERLEYLVSSDNIRKMMSENAGGVDGADAIKIYEYKFANPATSNVGVDLNPSVMTYLAHYPIAEMQLDLGKYVKQAVNSIGDGEVPTIEIPSKFMGHDLEQFFNLPGMTAIYLTTNSEGAFAPSLEDNGRPLYKVMLPDMVNLVQSVKGTKFGLRIPYIDNLENKIFVCIPAFDIGMTGTTRSYAPGITFTDTDNKKYLEFVSTKFGSGHPIYPKTDLNNGIDIFIKIGGACSGKFDLDLLFDWTEAVIDTSENVLSEAYPISSELLDFLGSDIEFDKVKGYVYVGIDDVFLDGQDIKMSLTYSTTSFFNGSIRPLADDQRPSFGSGANPFEYTGALLPHSLGTAPLDLEKMFQSDSASTRYLTYEIKIPTITIDRSKIDDDDESPMKITADLVVLLPLELKVTGEEYSLNSRNYVKLDLEAFQQEELMSGDLFGRSGNEDDLLKDLELDFVRITLKINENDITLIDKSKLAVLITAKNTNQIIRFGDSNPYIEFTQEALKYPFSPSFELLLEKENPTSTYGTFRVLNTKSPSFDFKMYVEAKASLKYRIDL